MNEVITSIISIVVTTVVLPLITLSGTKLIQYLNTKIKDENAKRILTSIATSVERAVRVVFQTYVESLKKSGTFDKEAQKTALVIAKQEVMRELDIKAKEFIVNNYGDLNAYITNQIESTINLLKFK
jgi:CMP-2-keto-3-deoxyoctulosonic acid synthetase